MKRLLTGLLGLLACVVSTFAADVAFTDEAGDHDLANAENWAGGKLPTSADIGIVNVDTDGGTLLCTSDVSFKGLRITGVGAFSLGQYGDTATITLGDGGLSLTASKFIYIYLNFATTCEQEWSIVPGYYSIAYFYGKISGDANLSVRLYCYLFFQSSPDYAGRIAFSRERDYWAEVCVYGAERLCESVRFDNVYCRFTTGKSAALADIFPSGTIEASGWSQGFRFDDALTDITFDGKATIGAEGDSSAFYDGTLRIVGGDYQLTKYQTTMIARNRASIYVTGGAYRPFALWLGQNGATSGAKVYQSGGVIDIERDLEIGGRIADNYDCNAMGLAGVYLTGGACSVSGTWPVRIGGHQTNLAEDETPGYLCIDGGTLTSNQGLLFGDSAGSAGRAMSFSTNHFGFFDMRGGELLAKDRWLQLGEGWNAVSSTSGRLTTDDAAASYRVALRGGTVKLVADETVGLQCEIQPGNEPFALEHEGSVEMNGPIWGTGALIKRGGGTLVLNDAARFTGSMTVEKGMVKVPGNSASPTGDCVVWCADDLKLSDGASVKSWGDASGTYTAGRDGDGVPLPTYSADAMNGHAAVRFSNSVACQEFLETAGGDANPLDGETNVTVAVVVKAMATGTGSQGTGWPYQAGIVGSFGGWGMNAFAISYDVYNQFFVGGTWDDSEQPNGRMETTLTPSLKGSDQAVHVLVATRHGKETSIDVDGVLVSVKNDGLTDRERNYPLYHSNEGQSYGAKFYIGYLGYAGGSCFNGYIAEIRIYKNRTLTVGERNGLAEALMLKYRGDEGVAHMRQQCNGTVLGTYSAIGTTDAPEGGEEWLADDLTVSDGGVVTEWSGSKGTSAEALGAAPTFVRNALNGRSFVRFAGAEALVVPGANVLTSGKTAFSAAVVFRTTTDGTSEDATIRTVAEGILGTRGSTAEKGANDWAIGWQKEGTVVSLIGSSVADDCIYRRKPCKLDDGVVHVAVMSVDLENGYLSQMVDGCPSGVATAALGARDAQDLAFGAMGSGAGFFAGEIGAVRLYDRALTGAEMMALTHYYCDRYKALPLGRVETENAALTGLGVTNVIVKAGAKLVLSELLTTPFTLKGAGATLAVESTGMIDGTVRFADGAILDGATLSGAVPDIWLDGGAVIRGGSDPAMLLGARLSGTIVVDTAAWDENFRNIPFLRVPTDSLKIENVTWTDAKGRAIRVKTVKDGADTVFLASGFGGFSIIIR